MRPGSEWRLTAYSNGMSETDMLAEIERLKEVIRFQEAQIATIKEWVEQQIKKRKIKSIEPDHGNNKRPA